jgi:hypothetical protein
MNKKESSVMLKCSCGCSMFVAEKTVWEDGDISYNLTVQDSRYDHNYNTIWGRVKSAMKVLFGKPVYYSDVYIDKPEKFKEFVDQLNKLYQADLEVGTNHSCIIV